MVGVKVGDGGGSNQAEDDVLSTTLSVSGMTCGHCQAKVEKALRGVDGVFGAEVNLPGGIAHVEAGDGVTNEMLIDAVRRAGYRAAVAPETA